jgi:hypothetical protein
MADGPDDAAATTAVLASPVALQKEFDRGRLPFVAGTGIPQINALEGVQMRGVAVPIMFCGRPVIELLPPERAAGPTQISILLGRRGEQPAQLVVLNEWRPPDGGWTFEWFGGRYSFENKEHDLRLVVAIAGPELLRIDALRTWCGDKLLEIDHRQATVDGKPVTLRSCRSELVGTTL